MEKKCKDIILLRHRVREHLRTHACCTVACVTAGVTAWLECRSAIVLLYPTVRLYCGVPAARKYKHSVNKGTNYNKLRAYHIFWTSYMKVAWIERPRKQVYKSCGPGLDEKKIGKVVVELSDAGGSF